LGVECNGVDGDPGRLGRSWGCQSCGAYWFIGALLQTPESDSFARPHRLPESPLSIEQKQQDVHLFFIGFSHLGVYRRILPALRARELIKIMNITLPSSFDISFF